MPSGSEQDVGAISLSIYGDSPWQDADLMRELYVDREFSSTEISELLGCARSTVMKWLNRHDIETRSQSQASQIKSSWAYYEDPIEVGMSGHVVWRMSTGTSNYTLGVHRLLAISEFGVEAVANSEVHHKNEIPWDNRPDNIELMSTEDHMRHHTQAVSGVERLRVAELYENGDIGSRPLGDMFDISGATVLYIHKEFFGERGEAA